MATLTVKVLAVILMALIWAPAGAHLFELPRKIGLERDAYFTVQQIYSGWALFGILIFAALVVNLVLAVLLRGERPAFYFAGAGVVAVVLSLAIFFAWTFPANQATANWTSVPENWEALRRSWEYSHAANAVVTFLGFCGVLLAAVTSHR